MKKKITKKALTELYWNNSNNEVADMLGITTRTLSNLINEYGIPKKGKGYKKTVVIIDNGDK